MPDDKYLKTLEALGETENTTNSQFKYKTGGAFGNVQARTLDDSFLPEEFYANVGEDKLAYARGMNQSTLNKLGSSVGYIGGSLVPGALEIIAQTVDPRNIGRLFTTGEDTYQNAVSEFMGGIKNTVQDQFRIYVPDEGKVWNPTSASWYLKNITSLTSSISEHMLASTLTGGGGLVAKGVSIFGRLMKGNGFLKALVPALVKGEKLTKNIGRLQTANVFSKVAQVAGSLEVGMGIGAINAAGVYKTAEATALASYNPKTGKKYTKEEAAKIASEAAATTYKVTALTNAVLNISSNAAFFKGGRVPINKLKPEKGEAGKSYLQRLKDLRESGEGMDKAKSMFGFMSTTLGEMGQESLEEYSEFIAQKLGETQALTDITGSKQTFDWFSEEAALTMTLGALGGAMGQGMRSLLHKKAEVDQQTQFSQALDQRIDYLEKFEKANGNLAKANQSGDKAAIEEAQNALFTNEAVNSLLTGQTELFEMRMGDIESMTEAEAKEQGFEVDEANGGKASWDYRQRAKAAKATVQKAKDIMREIQNDPNDDIELKKDMLNLRVSAAFSEQLIKGLKNDLALEEASISRGEEDSGFALDRPLTKVSEELEAVNGLISMMEAQATQRGEVDSAKMQYLIDLKQQKEKQLADLKAASPNAKVRRSIRGTSRVEKYRAMLLQEAVLADTEKAWEMYTDPKKRAELKELLKKDAERSERVEKAADKLTNSMVDYVTSASENRWKSIPKLKDLFGDDSFADFDHRPEQNGAFEVLSKVFGRINSADDLQESLNNKNLEDNPSANTGMRVDSEGNVYRQTRDPNTDRIVEEKVGHIVDIHQKIKYLADLSRMYDIQEQMELDPNAQSRVSLQNVMKTFRKALKEITRQDELQRRVDTLNTLESTKEPELEQGEKAAAQNWLTNWMSDNISEEDMEALDEMRTSEASREAAIRLLRKMKQDALLSDLEGNQLELLDTLSEMMVEDLYRETLIPSTMAQIREFPLDSLRSALLSPADVMLNESTPTAFKTHQVDDAGNHFTAIPAMRGEKEGAVVMLNGEYYFIAMNDNVVLQDMFVGDNFNVSEALVRKGIGESLDPNMPLAEQGVLIRTEARYELNLQIRGDRMEIAVGGKAFSFDPYNMRNVGETDEDGKLVSVTLTDESGREYTFKEPDFVEQMEELLLTYEAVMTEYISNRNTFEFDIEIFEPALKKHMRGTNRRKAGGTSTMAMVRISDFKGFEIAPKVFIKKPGKGNAWIETDMSKVIAGEPWKSKKVKGVKNKVASNAGALQQYYQGMLVMEQAFQEQVLKPVMEEFYNKQTTKKQNRQRTNRANNESDGTPSTVTPTTENAQQEQTTGSDAASQEGQQPTDEQSPQEGNQGNSQEGKTEQLSEIDKEFKKAQIDAKFEDAPWHAYAKTELENHKRILRFIMANKDGDELNMYMDSLERMAAYKGDSAAVQATTQAAAAALDLAEQVRKTMEVDRKRPKVEKEAETEKTREEADTLADTETDGDTEAEVEKVIDETLKGGDFDSEIDENEEADIDEELGLEDDEKVLGESEDSLVSLLEESTEDGEQDIEVTEEIEVDEKAAEPTKEPPKTRTESSPSLSKVGYSPDTLLMEANKNFAGLRIPSPWSRVNVGNSENIFNDSLSDLYGTDIVIRWYAQHTSAPITVSDVMRRFTDVKNEEDAQTIIGVMDSEGLLKKLDSYDVDTYKFIGTTQQVENFIAEMVHDEAPLTVDSAPDEKAQKRLETERTRLLDERLGHRKLSWVQVRKLLKHFGGKQQITMQQLENYISDNNFANVTEFELAQILTRFSVIKTSENINTAGEMIPTHLLRTNKEEKLNNMEVLALGEQVATMEKALTETDLQNMLTFTTDGGSDMDTMFSTRTKAQAETVATEEQNGEATNETGVTSDIENQKQKLREEADIEAVRGFHNTETGGVESATPYTILGDDADINIESMPKRVVGEDEDLISGRIYVSYFEPAGSTNTPQSSTNAEAKVFYRVSKNGKAIPFMIIDSGGVTYRSVRGIYYNATKNGNEYNLSQSEWKQNIATTKNIINQKARSLNKKGIWKQRPHPSRNETHEIHPSVAKKLLREADALFDANINAQNWSPEMVERASLLEYTVGLHSLPTVKTSRRVQGSKNRFIPVLNENGERETLEDEHISPNADALMSNPNVNSGTYEIEFLMFEGGNTWWQDNKDRYKNSPTWQMFPMYVAAVNKETGEKTVVGVLSTPKNKYAAKLRKYVYDKLSKGETVKAEFNPNGKNWAMRNGDYVNVAYVYDDKGKPKFFSLFEGENSLLNTWTVGEDGDFVKATKPEEVLLMTTQGLKRNTSDIMDSSVLRAAPHIRLATGMSMERRDALEDFMSHFDDIELDANPGQVFVMQVDPNGRPKIVPLSTANVSDHMIDNFFVSAMNAMGGTTMDDYMEMENKLRAFLPLEAGQTFYSQKDYFKLGRIQREDGTVVPTLTYFDKALGKPVRVNITDYDGGKLAGKKGLRSAMNDNDDVVSVQVGKFEPDAQGRPKFIPTKTTDISMQNVRRALKQRKVHVNRESINSAGEYVFPFEGGIVFDSYKHFLSGFPAKDGTANPLISQENMSGDHAAILQHNVSTKNGSPFVNAGTQFSNVTVSVDGVQMGIRDAAQKAAKAERKAAEAVEQTKKEQAEKEARIQRARQEERQQIEDSKNSALDERNVYEMAQKQEPYDEDQMKSLANKAGVFGQHGFLSNVMNASAFKYAESFEDILKIIEDGMLDGVKETKQTKTEAAKWLKELKALVEKIPALKEMDKTQSISSFLINRHLPANKQIKKSKVGIKSMTDGSLEWGIKSALMAENERLPHADDTAVLTVIVSKKTGKSTSLTPELLEAIRATSRELGIPIAIRKGTELFALVNPDNDFVIERKVEEVEVEEQDDPNSGSAEGKKPTTKKPEPKPTKKETKVESGAKEPESSDVEKAEKASKDRKQKEKEGKVDTTPGVDNKTEGEESKTDSSGNKQKKTTKKKTTKKRGVLKKSYNPENFAQNDESLDGVEGVTEIKQSFAEYRARLQESIRRNVPEQALEVMGLGHSIEAMIDVLLDKTLGAHVGMMSGGFGSSHDATVNYLSRLTDAVEKHPLKALSDLIASHTTPVFNMLGEKKAASTVQRVDTLIAYAEETKKTMTQYMEEAGFTKTQIQKVEKALLESMGNASKNRSDFSTYSNLLTMYSNAINDLFEIQTRPDEFKKKLKSRGNKWNYSKVETTPKTETQAESMKDLATTSDEALLSMANIAGQMHTTSKEPFKNILRYFYQHKQSPHYSEVMEAVNAADANVNKSLKALKDSKEMQAVKNSKGTTSDREVAYKLLENLMRDVARRSAITAYGRSFLLSSEDGEFDGTVNVDAVLENVFQHMKGNVRGEDVQQKLVALGERLDKLGKQIQKELVSYIDKNGKKYTQSEANVYSNLQYAVSEANMMTKLSPHMLLESDIDYANQQLTKFAKRIVAAQSGFPILESVVGNNYNPLIPAMSMRSVVDLGILPSLGKHHIAQKLAPKPKKPSKPVDKEQKRKKDAEKKVNNIAKGFEKTAGHKFPKWLHDVLLQSEAMALTTSDEAGYYLRPGTGNKYHRVSTFTGKGMQEVEVTNLKGDKVKTPKAMKIRTSVHVGTFVDEYFRIYLEEKIVNQNNDKNLWKTVGEQARKEWDGSRWVKKPMVDDTTLKQLAQAVDTVIKHIQTKGQTPLGLDFQRAGEIEVNGKVYPVAGTTDIVAIDANGDEHIYDLKTFRVNPDAQRDATGFSMSRWQREYRGNRSKFTKNVLQQVLYKRLSELNGSRVKSLNIVPIDVEYAENGKSVKTAKDEFTFRNVSSPEGFTTIKIEEGDIDEEMYLDPTKDEDEDIDPGIKITTKDGRKIVEKSNPKKVGLTKNQKRWHKGQGSASPLNKGKTQKQQKKEEQNKIKDAQNKRGEETTLPKNAPKVIGNKRKRKFRFKNQSSSTISIKSASEWLNKRGMSFDETKQVFRVANQLSGDKVAHGYFEDGLVYLNENAEVGTEYHEAFHVVFNTWMSPRQAKEVLMEAKRNLRPPSDEELNNLAELHPNLAADELIDLYYEEVLAEKFRDYVMKNQSPKTTTGKIMKFFKDLVAYMKTFFRHRKTINQLFRNIESGYYGKRYKRNTKSPRKYSIKEKFTPTQVNNFTTAISSSVLDSFYTDGTKNTTESYKKAKQTVSHHFVENLLMTDDTENASRLKDFLTEFGSTEAEQKFNLANQFVKSAKKYTSAMNALIEAAETEAEYEAVFENDFAEWIARDAEENGDKAAGLVAQAYASEMIAPIFEETGGMLEDAQEALDEGDLENASRLRQNAEKIDNARMLFNVLRYWNSTNPEAPGEVVVNDPGFEQMSKDTLEDFGLRVTEQAIEGNVSFDKEHVYDKGNLEKNRQDSLSGEVKNFFSRIPELDNNGEPRELAGLPMYLPFQEVFRELSAIMSKDGSIASKKEMLERMETLAKRNPKFGVIPARVLEMMKSDEMSDKMLVNQVYRALAMTYTNTVALQDRVNRDGTRTVRVFDSNTTNATKQYMKSWEANFTSPSGMLYVDALGNLIVSEGKLKQLKNANRKLAPFLKKSKKDVPAQAVIVAKEIFDLLGIEVFGELDTMNEVDVETMQNAFNEGIKWGRRTYKGYNLLRLMFKNINTSARGSGVGLADVIKSIELRKNPYTTDTPFFTTIAKALDDYVHTTTMSFTSASNKLLHPIATHTTVTRQFGALKKMAERGSTKGTTPFEHMIENMLQDRSLVLDKTNPETANIFLGQTVLAQNRDFTESLQFAMFDAFKANDGTEEYTDMAELKEWAVRLNMFANNSSSKNMYITAPTFADRGNMYAIRLPRLGINRNRTNSAAYNLRAGQSINNLFENIIQRELVRINEEAKMIFGNAADENDTGVFDEDGNMNITNLVKNYHFKMKDGKAVVGQALDFNVFNEFAQSSHELKELLEAAQEGKLEFLGVGVSKQLNKVAKRAVGHYMEQGRELADRLGQIGFNRKTTLVRREIGGTTSKNEVSQYEIDTSLWNNSLIEMTSEFAVVDALVKAELRQFTGGNTGLYKNSANFNKRYGGLMTPGWEVVFEEEIDGKMSEGSKPDYSMAILNDVFSENDAIEAVKELKELAKTRNSQNSNRLAMMLQKHYIDRRSNKSDAMGIASIHKYRSLKKGEGTWSNAYENAYQNYLKTKEFKTTRDDSKQIPEGQIPILGPLKTYHDGQYLHNGRMVRVMVKHSLYPLLADYSQSSPRLDEMRKILESEGKYSEFDIDEFNMDSAVKVGLINANTVTDFEKGSLENGDYEVDFTSLKAFPIRLSSQQQRTPQVMPKRKAANKFGSQMMKLVELGINDISEIDIPGFKTNGKGWREAYENLLGIKYLEGKKLVEKELGIDQFGSSVKDLEALKNLRSIMVETVRERGLPDSYVRALDIVEVPATGKTKEGTPKAEYNFRIPMNSPTFGDKFESVLFSIFKNRALTLDINGKAMVQIADIGAVVDDGTLKFVHAKDGKPQYAEVAIPFDQAEKMGLPKKANGEFDLSNVDDRILTMVGYRIPTQGLNSMLPLKIVRVLPKHMGKVIQVPGDITTQMGSDFDVDKLFTIQPNYRTFAVDTDGNRMDIPKTFMNAVNQLMEANDMSSTLGYKDFRYLWNQIDEFGDTEAVYKLFKEGRIKGDSRILGDLFNESFKYVKELADENFSHMELEYKDPTDDRFLKSVMRKSVKGGDVKFENAVENISDMDYVDNALVEMLLTNLGHIERLADVVTPLDSPTMASLKEVAKNVVKHPSFNDNLQYDNVSTEIMFALRNKFGKAGIGIWATSITGHSVSTATELRASDEYKVRIAEAGDQEVSMLNKTVDNAGIPINEHLSKHLSNAVDNANDPIMSFILDDGITAGGTNYIIRTGIVVPELGKALSKKLNSTPEETGLTGSAPELATVIRLQPMLIEVFQHMQNVNMSSFDLAEGVFEFLQRNEKKSVAKKLRKAFVARVEADDSKTTTMSATGLVDNLGKKWEQMTMEEKLEQMEIAANWYMFNQIGSELNQLHRLVYNADVAKNRLKNALEIQDYLRKREDLLNRLKPRKYGKPKPLSGFEVGLPRYLDVITDTFQKVSDVSNDLSTIPMQEIISEIEYLGVQVPADQLRNMRDFMSTYAVAFGKHDGAKFKNRYMDEYGDKLNLSHAFSPEFFQSALSTVHPDGRLKTKEELEETLVGRWQNFKERVKRGDFPTLIGNSVVKMIEPHSANNRTVARVMRLKKNRTGEMSKHDLNKMAADYSRLANYTDSESEETNQRVRQLAEDLLLYSVAIDGLQSTADSFVDAFETYEVFEKYSNYRDQLQDGKTTFKKRGTAFPARVFIEHNWRDLKVPSINLLPMNAFQKFQKIKDAKIHGNFQELSIFPLYKENARSPMYIVNKKTGELMKRVDVEINDFMDRKIVVGQSAAQFAVYSTTEVQVNSQKREIFISETPVAKGDDGTYFEFRPRAVFEIHNEMRVLQEEQRRRDQCKMSDDAGHDAALFMDDGTMRYDDYMVPNTDGTMGMSNLDASMPAYTDTDLAIASAEVMDYDVF